MKGAIPILAGLLLVSPAARPDELRLKDGTKIIGTIVGFEEDSFKVKTSYGYAVIRRDEVAFINVTDSSGKAVPDAKPAPEAKTVPEKKPSPEKKRAPVAISAAAPMTAPAEPAKEETKASPSPTTQSTPTVASANPPAPAPAAPPAKPTAPEPMREEVSGNEYKNLTYGFRMYKPPDWQVIEGARKVLPGAIAAMGTGDQTTYLLIGQEPAGGTDEENLAGAESRLREVLENFRPLGDKRMTISGASAVARRFRGSIDDHDWSGMVVLIPHDNRLYTIYGMTYADSDLVQIQENVISRAISSLEFMKR